MARMIGKEMSKIHDSFVQGINCVSSFNAGHIFVDFSMIMHRTVKKFGMNIEAKHTSDL